MPMTCCELGCRTGYTSIAERRKTKLEKEKMKKGEKKPDFFQIEEEDGSTASDDDGEKHVEERMETTRNQSLANTNQPISEEVVVGPTTTTSSSVPPSSSSSVTDDKSISLHSFPLNNPELLAMWLKKLHRKNYKPNKNSRICSLHFAKEDFQFTRTDSNRNRRSFRHGLLMNRRLKPDAVPNLTSRERRTMRRTLDSLPKPVRTIKVKSKAASRQSVLGKRDIDEEIEVQFSNAETNRLKSLVHAQDRIKDLDDIERRLKKAGDTAEGFSIFRKGDSLLLCLLDTELHEIPQMRALIRIHNSLDFSISHEGTMVPREKYSHIVRWRLEMFSQVVGLMEEVKSWVVGSDGPKLPWLKMAAECLETYISNQTSPESDDFVNKIRFILEQLELRMATGPNARRYSSQLTSFAYWIFAFSRQIYRQLLDQDVVILPSETHLTKLRKSVGLGSRPAGFSQETGTASYSESGGGVWVPSQEPGGPGVVYEEDYGGLNQGHVIYMTEEEWRNYLNNTMEDDAIIHQQYFGHVQPPPIGHHS